MNGAEPSQHRILNRWGRSAVLAVGFLLLTFLGLSLYADTAQLEAALSGFDLRVLGPALGFSLLSYLLRATRFQLFLRGAEIKVPHGEAALIFLSGMSLSATPGKVGELLKSVLLKQRHGVAFRSSVPIVVVERVSDLIALLLLTAAGLSIAVDAGPAAGLLVGLAVVIFLGCCAVHLLRGSPLATLIPFPSRWRPRFDDALTSFSNATRPGPLLGLLPLGIASWGCQVLCLWVIVRGFAGGTLEISTATFAYCVPLLAGVMAFLPGGLGVTEAGMVHSLQLVATWITPALAASITLLARLATFWFAMLVGLSAVLIHRRYFPWSTRVASEPG